MDDESDSQVELEEMLGCNMPSSLFLRTLIDTDFVRDC